MKRGKNFGMLGLFALILIVGIAVLFIKNRKTVTDTAAVVARDLEQAAYADDLVLYLSESDFRIDEEGTLSLTAVCSESVTEPVVVVNERGETVCSLTDNGNGMWSGQVTIFEESERVGTLTAKSGDITSMSKHFYVLPEITMEMVGNLQTVVSDVGNYALEQNFKDPHGEEALAEMKAWIEKDPRIAAVEENNGVLLFQTTDHLIGSYGMGVTSENSFGFSPPEMAYDAFEKEEKLTKYYLRSGIPITNTKMLHLSPVPDDRVVTAASGIFKDLEQSIADVLGFSLEWREGIQAVRALAEGDMADYGYMAFNTHGNVIDRKTGGNLLFFYIGYWDRDYAVDLMESIGLTEDQCYNFWGSIEDKDDAYRLTMDAAIVDGEWKFTMWASTNYLECVLADKTFDNTVIYMIVCHAMSDVRLRQLFFNHGASAVMGCEQPLEVGVAITALEQIAQVMGGLNKNGSYGSLNDLMEAPISEKTQETVRQIPYYAEEKHYKEYEEKLRTAPVICYYRTDAKKRVFEGMGALEGAVLTENKEAVSGANVSFYLWRDHIFSNIWETVTDKNGNYHAEKLPYGIYAVHAQKDEASEFEIICLDEKNGAETVEDIVFEDKVEIYVLDSVTRYYDGKAEGYRKTWEYDEDGNIISEKTFESGEVFDTTTYTYQDGKLVSCLFEPSDAKRREDYGHRAEYSYDSGGYLSEVAYYYLDGSFMTRYEFTVDEQGRKTGYAEDASHNPEDWRQRYIWEGDLLTAIEDLTHGEVFSRLRYVYDSDGNCISVINVRGDGSVAGETKIHYENGIRTFAETSNTRWEYNYVALKVSKEAAERYYQRQKEEPFVQY